MDSYVSNPAPHSQGEAGTSRESNQSGFGATSGASPGQSRPENAPSPPGPEPSGPEPCECEFCDGVTVEGYDPRTGEDRSFERMSRRCRCPNCGGMNVQYRKSYTAHAAAVAREKGRTRHAYFVTLVLDRRPADRAGIDGEASYQVLAGQRGVWTRTRRAVKRRDGEAEYLGTLSARPSDGRWHAHVLVLTSLSRHELERALHVTGADAYISAPDGEDHEQFGARKGAYAFDNAANSPSARFISSRGEGVGYDSEAAVARRRDAVQDSQGGGETSGGSTGADTGARSLRRNEQRERGADTGKNEQEAAGNGTAEGDSSSESGDRAPPVQCDGETFGTLGAYLRAVKQTLAGRVGTTVYVRGLGNCTLLKVAHSEDGDGIACTVAPLDVDTGGTVEVKWAEITARNVPVVRRSMNRPDSSDMLDSNATADRTGEGDPGGNGTGEDPVDRFYEEARYSTVTTELPDGRRRVSVKDHETGEFTEHIKPPRQK